MSNRIWFGRTFLVTFEPLYSWGLGFHVLRWTCRRWKIDVHLLCLSFHYGN